MGRRANILYQASDAFGDWWDVREERRTPHGFCVLIGWPTGQPRGRGYGGPKVIITDVLQAYLEEHRLYPGRIALPIGRTTVKRLRSLLGHNWYSDNRGWWEERFDDLLQLTLAEFAARHGVSESAASLAHTAWFGPRIRSAGWWREEPARAALLSDLPNAVIAEQLGIAIGSVGRLRPSLLREMGYTDEQIRERGLARIQAANAARPMTPATAAALRQAASKPKSNRWRAEMSARNRRRTGLPEHLLGTMPDAELARAYGCSQPWVHQLRTAKGIPAYCKTRPMLDPVKLVHLRRANGLTQRDVADRLGVGNGYVSRIESGGYKPSIRVITRVAAALGCRPEDLLRD